MYQVLLSSMLQLTTVNPFISSSLYFSDLGITSSWTSLNFSVLLKQNLMNFLALYRMKTINLVYTSTSIQNEPIQKVQKT